MSPGAGIAVVSLVANAVIGGLWLSARDEVTRAGVETANAQQAAGLCSRGVAEMRARSIQADRLASAARAAAAERAATAAAKADEILTWAPAVPGDACASAQKAIDTWLKGRAP